MNSNLTLKLFVLRFGRRRPLTLAFFICGMANVIAVITITIESGIKFQGCSNCFISWPWGIGGTIGIDHIGIVLFFSAYTPP